MDDCKAVLNANLPNWPGVASTLFITSSQEGEAGTFLLVRGKLGLHTAFQTRQDYIVETFFSFFLLIA